VKRKGVEADGFLCGRKQRGRVMMLKGVELGHAMELEESISLGTPFYRSKNGVDSSKRTLFNAPPLL
jgi:hypothetical protein